jgi:hypothetical protein
VLWDRDRLERASAVAAAQENERALVEQIQLLDSAEAGQRLERHAPVSAATRLVIPWALSNPAVGIFITPRAVFDISR